MSTSCPLTDSHCGRFLANSSGRQECRGMGCYYNRIWWYAFSNLPFTPSYLRKLVFLRFLCRLAIRFKCVTHSEMGFIGNWPPNTRF